MAIFKKEYRDLEMRVLNELRTLIEKSEYNPENYNHKAIQVNVFDYTELAIINDRLTFLDSNGMQYSIYADCNLEDLIDILNKA